MATQTKIEKSRHRLLAAADIVDKGDIAIIQKIYEMMEFLDDHKGSVEDIVKKYVDGIKVIHGKDGSNYAITESDIKKIAKSIQIPVVKQIVEKHKETVVREIPVVRETIVKEPLAIKFSPQELRDLLELLKGDERIDARSIRGFEELIRFNPGNGPMLHTPALANLPDVVAVGVTTGQILQWNGTYWTNVNNSAASGFTTLPPTETPNGSRTVFTLSTATSQPTFIISDNVMMQATTKSGTVNWTWNGGTKQATMTIPPNDDLIGIQ